MRVYLDNCAIQRPLDDQRHLRIRAEAEAMRGLLGLIETNRVELLKSMAHKIENRRNPHSDRRDFTTAVLHHGRHVEYSSRVASLASEYRERSITPLDALHLASAVLGGADFFITTDDDLLKKGRAADTRDTIVVSPLELITYLP